jgi:hypothetical protein
MIACPSRLAHTVYSVSSGCRSCDIGPARRRRARSGIAVVQRHRAVPAIECFRPYSEVFRSRDIVALSGTSDAESESGPSLTGFYSEWRGIRTDLETRRKKMGRDLRRCRQFPHGTMVPRIELSFFGYQCPNEPTPLPDEEPEDRATPIAERPSEWSSPRRSKMCEVWLLISDVPDPPPEASLIA